MSKVPELRAVVAMATSTVAFLVAGVCCLVAAVGVLRIRSGSDGLGHEPVELDQHAGDLAGGDQTAGVAR
jgi:hypothetical protein